MFFVEVFLFSICIPLMFGLCHGFHLQSKFQCTLKTESLVSLKCLYKTKNNYVPDKDQSYFDCCCKDNLLFIIVFYMILNSFCVTGEKLSTCNSIVFFKTTDHVQSLQFLPVTNSFQLLDSYSIYLTNPIGQHSNTIILLKNDLSLFPVGT